MAVSDRMKRNPNCVGIIVDEAKKGFSGRVYNCYSKDPQHFKDITELFYIVENVMDSLNFPAAKTRVRAFKRTESTFYIEKINTENKVLEADELIPDLERKGYVLMITGRDNATWQGMIYDKEKDVDINFNSEVELIKILK